MRMVALEKTETEGVYNVLVCRNTKKLEERFPEDHKIVSAVFTNDTMVFQKALLKARTFSCRGYRNKMYRQGINDSYMGTEYKLLGIAVEQYMRECRERGVKPEELSGIQLRAYNYLVTCRN